MPGFFFGGFQTVFFIAFFAILTVIIITAVRGIAQNRRNNKAPRLTVEATVVSKRTDVTRHHHNSGVMANGVSTGMHTSSSTWYYATFQVQSGDRMELSVSGNDYGMLAEGDHGMLSFQGTRYLGFERI